jgi:arylformamidase
MSHRTLQAVLLVSLFTAPASVGADEGASSRQKRDVAYAGEASHPLQKLDAYWTEGRAAQPVMVYIHGGGWRRGDKGNVGAKPNVFAEHGMAFVSVNYRLSPEVGFQEQAADVAHAIKHVVDHAAQAGVDPTRVYLMGHSAGAHLAALVATDGKYLQAAGLSLATIKGVVLLDGAGYDIPRQIATVGRPIAVEMYQSIFTADPATQAQASPITHVAAGKHIPPFLILPIADRPDSGAQSDALAAKLREAAVAAEVVRCPNQTHGSINQDFGTADHLATTETFEFLKRLQTPAAGAGEVPSAKAP